MGHDLDVVLPGQQPSHLDAGRNFVVDDERADFHAAAVRRGISMRAQTPPSGAAVSAK